jgi:A/G-specific adenine glycosylase
VKSKAKTARVRFFHYVVFEWQGSYYFRKRIAGDIWQGLYDFYLYEADDKNLATKVLLDELNGAGIELIEDQLPLPQKEYKHVLSHQKITAKFYLVKLKNRLNDKVLQESRLALFEKDKIEDLPKPVLINNYLKDVKILVNL